MIDEADSLEKQPKRCSTDTTKNEDVTDGGQDNANIEAEHGSRRGKQSRKRKAQVRPPSPVEDEGDDASTVALGEGPWSDICAKIKLFVCMEPRNLSNSEIMIRNANEEFFSNFGFPDTNLPLPLKQLFGPTTDRFVIHKIQMAILLGKQACEFVNLYSHCKTQAMACHILVVSITGNRNSTVAQGVTAATAHNSESYAVITIQSASKVGNAKAYGIGFFGSGRITTRSSTQARTDLPDDGFEADSSSKRSKLDEPAAEHDRESNHLPQRR